jgi:hypothetical protein
MKITVERTANAPADALWAYMGDFSNVHKFHPMLNDSHFIEGSQSCDVGSTRQCNFKDGSILKERITEWKDGSHYKIDIVESSMPVDNASAKLGVRSIGGGQTLTYMTVEAKPKNKLMQPMMYMIFKYKVIPGILKGLEDLYKSDLAVESTLKSTTTV